jgi:hypothetical protein
MSFSYDETEQPIVYDVESKEIIFYDEAKKGVKEARGIFEPIPNIKKGMEYGVMFIVAAMGGGKTHFSMNIADQYKRLFNKNKIYYFCQKPSDPVVDEHVALKLERIQLNDDFLEKEIDVTREKKFHNCMVIFDDFMTIPNKKLVEKILQLIIQFIQMGRQYRVYVLITSHQFYGFRNKELYANIQTETTQIVWFLSKNVYQLTYVLKMYWGYSAVQIKKFLKMDDDSRWTLLNRFPAYILTQNKCLLL